MITDVGYVLAGLTGVFSLVLSARAILQPHPAAVGFGVAPMPGLAPYMAIKGSRDLAVGAVILALLGTANSHAPRRRRTRGSGHPAHGRRHRAPHRRVEGHRIGVHYATAAIMIATAAMLLPG